MVARGLIGAPDAFSPVEDRVKKMSSAMENRVRAKWLALLALALSSTVSASGPASIATISVDPPAPSRALARYLAGAANGDPWSEPNPVLIEIDASLPELAEEGHLRAIRHWIERQTPDYQVIHIEGDATVKQQVIARYLTAEKARRGCAGFVGCGDAREL